MVQVWAYLVSIEKYADASWPTVLGADLDTQLVYDYLIKDLSVPPDNIVRLTGSEATRKNIIETFKTHLIDNKRIARGDAILFHFSGHGSRGWAPLGWTVVESAEEPEEERGQLEMIIPYDDGVHDASGKPACGIPDRTLGALLDRVSSAHGDNIVVVLDCCHSGSGTRGRKKEEDPDEEELVARGLDPSQVAPLRGDVDSDLLHDLPKQSLRRGIAANRASRNHVLMAACTQHQEAKGGRNGGLFTRFWLQALRNPTISPRTYAEMLKFVDKQFAIIRARRPGFEQNPQCEGVVRDRLVFEETIMAGNFFAAEQRPDLGRNVCRIEAGEVQGIQPGTLFELHELDDRFQSRRTLGLATAKEVDATYCIAEYPGDIVFTSPKCTAVVVQIPSSLVFAVHNMAPNAPVALEALEAFRASLDGAAPKDLGALREVRYGDKADLVLEIDEDGAMTLRRLDEQIGALKNVAPKLSPDEVKVADFPYILNAIARFNRFLALENPRHPLSEHVQLEMHLLWPSTEDVEAEYEDEQDVLQCERYVSRAIKSQVPFVDNEATVSDKPTDDYVFILQNQHDRPLFAYMYYFDPSTYQIVEWYNSFEREKATLHANGTLQLGASSERAEPYGFALPEGEDVERDTGFLKVFVLDTKSDMEFLAQEPVLGSVDPETGESVVMKGYKQRAGEAAAETKGRWDTLLRKITVLSSSDDSVDLTV